CKRSVEYDDSVADQTAGTVPFENTVLNISACDSPDAGSLECLTDFGVSEDLLLEYRIQHALHGSLHVFDGIVDHAVKPYIHALALCDVFCSRIRTHVESDDDRIGG